MTVVRGGNTLGWDSVAPAAGGASHNSLRSQMGDYLAESGPALLPNGYGDHHEYQRLGRSARSASTSSDQSLDPSLDSSSGAGSLASLPSPGPFSVSSHTLIQSLPSTPIKGFVTNDLAGSKPPARRGTSHEEVPTLSRILDFHRSLASHYTNGHRPSLPNNFYVGPPPLSPKNDMPEIPRDPRVRAMSADVSLSTSQLQNLQLRSILRSNGPQSPNSSESSTPTTPVDFEAPFSNGYATCRKAIKFNLTPIDENMFKRPMRSLPQTDTSTLPLSRRRSNSTSLLDVKGSYDDEEEDEYELEKDDFGFLSYYGLQYTFPPTAMQKVKSPAPTHKLLAKRWRKVKFGSSKAYSSVWKTEGECAWISKHGKRVVLTGTSFLGLSEMERLAVQKLAVAKLQAMSLGCAITIPKEGSIKSRSKRSAFSLKRKTQQDSSISGWVFGIPLNKVVCNDGEMRRRRPSLLQDRRESEDSTQQTPSQSSGRHSSTSSVSLDASPVGQQRSRSVVLDSSEADACRMELLRSVSVHGGVSSDSMSESDTRSASSSLLDALSLSSSAKMERKDSWKGSRESLTPPAPQVPCIVSKCCKHLEIYGLRVLGIFRIGSSKKRTKQLREEFDSACDVQLGQEHNPHDVGALLKDFFRLLPDPLLTRQLYATFVATRKLKDRSKRIKALNFLVALLPIINRDTLWTLLKFLSVIVAHSTDVLDKQGQVLHGNKMDSHNLATLFGPNLLHKAKGGEFEVETMERAEERREVIAVVQDMIENFQRIFELSAEVHDEVLRLLQETNPEGADQLLKRISASSGIDVDPETSSSFYEESDTSSMQRSPSYSSETDSAHPRNLTEALAFQQRSASLSEGTTSSQHAKREERNTDTLKVPQFRITSPDQVWYRPESRSPSPVSPRISPSPKAMKPGVPNLHISIARDSERTSMPTTSPTTEALVSPRPMRYRRHCRPGLVQSGGTPSAIPKENKVQTLTVPSLRKDCRDSDSCSSLSSYYPASSRSGTASPMTPEVSHSSRVWYPDTPPRTPGHDSVSPREDTPDRDARTSSTQRPLGFHSQQVVHRKLQPDRWKHWEILAQEHGDDFHEQETLV